jgi:hypothetical protein
VPSVTIPANPKMSMKVGSDKLTLLFVIHGMARLKRAIPDAELKRRIDQTVYCVPPRSHRNTRYIRLNWAGLALARQ